MTVKMMPERLTTDHERYMRFVLGNNGPAKDYERGISRDDIRLLMHEIDCLREDNARLRVEDEHDFLTRQAFYEAGPGGDYRRWSERCAAAEAKLKEAAEHIRSVLDDAEDLLRMAKIDPPDYPGSYIAARAFLASLDKGGDHDR